MERATLGSDEMRVLEFLAEHRVVVLTQLQALLGCDAQRATQRLRGLLTAGLAARQPIFEGLPAACWITRQGLGAIGSRLPAPRLDLKGYRHDVGVAWLWLAARDGAFGQLSSVVSERHMRSADRRDRAGPEGPGLAGHGYGIGVGPGPRRHYPDLMLETASGHRVAVELELTGKSARRLDGIMLGFAADPRVDAVLYLCPPGQIGREVQAAARRAGISNRVHVQQLAPGSPGGATLPARTVERRLTRRLPTPTAAAEL